MHSTANQHLLLPPLLLLVLVAVPLLTQYPIIITVTALVDLCNRALITRRDSLLIDGPSMGKDHLPVPSDTIPAEGVWVLLHRNTTDDTFSDEDSFAAAGGETHSFFCKDDDDDREDSSAS